MEWNFDNSKSIWLQITERLRVMIVCGIYPMGERLPSVRELAAQAGVNPNTMQRALSQLEVEGLAESNRTAGRIVTTNSEIIDNVRRTMAKGNVKAYFDAMKQIGFDRERAIMMINESEEE